ncbi:MAG: hypothetical protein KIS92_24760 [Planctomycetota bacterium]|nr:hypothetical protein [Planctomycetota bacterium]
MEHTLLYDDFAGLREGLVKEFIDGPYREMHGQPAHPDDNMDGWQSKVGHWSIGKHPWSCVATPRGKRLRATANPTVCDNVTLGKGDMAWRDLRVRAEVCLLPQSGDGWGGPVGLLFRFLDSTRFYAAVLDVDGHAKLLRRVVPNNWDVLDDRPARVAPGAPFEIEARAEGRRLSATVAGVELRAEDGEYAHGCIGVIAAQPAEFGPIAVTCGEAEKRRLDEAAAATFHILTKKRAGAGQPKLWKRIETPGFGAARRVRLGDLDGDGRLDFVLPRLHPRRDPGAAYLAAVDFDGRLLWERGEKPAAPTPETSGDAPVQIHDLDGDGRNEVVCVMDHTLLALDGRTGAVKYSAPVPKPTPLPEVYKQNINHWGGGYDDEGEHLPACAISFADLAGRGSARDVILSGHYHQTVALGPDFRERWRIANVRGHFPIPYRPKGEARDHVLAGYRHVDAEGRTVGRVCLRDHQDAIYAGPFDDAASGPDRIVMAGGDDGLLLLTPGYALHERVMGHVQRIAIGKFRADRGGLCLATVLFHGNRGIASLFDATFKRVWTRDYPVVGATLQPVLFDACGEERMLLSGMRPAQGFAGGLIDGDGDLVAALPDDGGPGLCALAQDFDGDGLDELMLWDHERIWIYHSDTEADPARLLKRERPPLYNMSNFQSYWSRAKR